MSLSFKFEKQPENFLESSYRRYLKITMQGNHHLYRIAKNAGIFNHLVCTIPKIQSKSELKLILGQFDGVYFNVCLLPGPDLNNILLGVLKKCLQKDTVTVIAEIQQCLLACEVCCDVLHFLWHCDNDLSKVGEEMH